MDACPFCSMASGSVDDDLIALRTPRVFVLVPTQQRARNRGHMLVLPRAHVTRLVDADAVLVQELCAVVGRVSDAVRTAFGATGATIFHNEHAPDQELLHLHVHVVPRHVGDGFRMPDPVRDTLDREERRRQAAALREVLG